MRYHYLRFDIWLCLALGFLASMLTGNIVEKISPKAYETYSEEHVVASGDVRKCSR